MILRRLRERGFLGMNRRNFDYIQAWNPRSLYPLVDDKVKTKEICADAGVPTPRTIGVVSQLHELNQLERTLESEESFVVKPSRGAQGNGILVATGRQGEHWQRSSGHAISRDDLRFRVAEILSGLFSLSGQPDRALVEECLSVHPALASVVHGGVPDIRVIVYRRHPVMAMLRLPTKSADGRANLHQGALGVGLSLATGRPIGAICESRPVDHHPDTGTRLDEIEIPDFDELLRIATVAGSHTDLGYVGVDLVLDADRGPVVLELNARPGLSIQLANSAGLVLRLKKIDLQARDNASVEDRIQVSRDVEYRCSA